MEALEILTVLMTCLGIAFVVMLGFILSGCVLGNLMYWMCEELPNCRRRKNNG